MTVIKKNLKDRRMALQSGNHFMKNRIKEIIAFTALVIVVLAGLMNIAII